MTFHTRSWKEREVKELHELFVSNPVVAIVDLQSLPSALFSKLRKKAFRQGSNEGFKDKDNEDGSCLQRKRGIKRVCWKKLCSNFYRHQSI
ncbi:MAG: 50S ribosomal protein L10 [Candidatus Diapherotrites archaeon]|nr:50S ribosomal protein L10 [Candidatus Diapherotrites archaeon]